MEFLSFRKFGGMQQRQQCFFWTKAIPQSLSNTCDYVLNFNFKIAHITGWINPAANFLSSLEL